MPSFCQAVGKIAPELKWVDFDTLWQKRGKTPTTTLFVFDSTTPPAPRHYSGARAESALSGMRLTAHHRKYVFFLAAGKSDTS